jgi:hypothetical protein
MIIISEEIESCEIWDEGINHLTTDNMIYECLRKAQLHDELLQKFVIKFIDSTIAQKPNTAQKNTIYVARGQSNLVNRSYSCQQFDTSIDVIIALREYNTPQAMRILKTMYKCILYHLSNDECWDYMQVMSYHFEYREPAILDRGIINFKASEVEDFCYDYDPCPILTLLSVTTSIEGTNEKTIRLKPKEFKHGK